MREGIEQSDHDAATRAQRRANRRQSTRRKSSLALKAGIDSFRSIIVKMTSQPAMVVGPHLLIDDHEIEDIGLPGQDQQDRQNDADLNKRGKLVRCPSGGSNLLTLLADAGRELNDEDYSPTDSDSDDDEAMDIFEYQDDALRGLLQFIPEKLNQLLQNPAGPVEGMVVTGQISSDLICLSPEQEPEQTIDSGTTQESRRRRISRRDRGAPVPSSSLRSASGASKRSSTRSQGPPSRSASQRRTSTTTRLVESAAFCTSSHRSNSTPTGKEGSTKRREHCERRSQGQHRASERRSGDKLERSDVIDRHSQGKRHPANDRRKRSQGNETRSSSNSNVTRTLSGLDMENSERNRRGRGTSSGPKKRRCSNVTSITRCTSVAPGSSSRSSHHNSMARSYSDRSGCTSSRRRSQSCTSRRESVNECAPTIPKVLQQETAGPLASSSSAHKARTPSTSRRKSTSDAYKSRRRKEKSPKHATEDVSSRDREEVCAKQHDVARCVEPCDNVDINHGDVEQLQLVVDSIPDRSHHTLSKEKTDIPARFERREVYDNECDTTSVEYLQSSHAPMKEKAWSRTLSSKLRSQRQFLAKPSTGKANISTDTPLGVF